MEHYVGIDVSLELSSVCVVDGRGKIVKEAKVASEPEAFVCFFKELGFPVNRIGLEAGPLSQWLHAGLTQAGFDTVLLETRHERGAGAGKNGAGDAKVGKTQKDIWRETCAGADDVRVSCRHGPQHCRFRYRFAPRDEGADGTDWCREGLQ